MIYAYLQGYAQENETLLLASIGGWSYANRFTSFFRDVRDAQMAGITADNLILKNFLDTMDAWLVANPMFQGISIDWEAPGFEHDFGLPVDNLEHRGEAKFFNLFIQEVSDRLAEMTQRENKDYYLTVAAFVNPKVAAGDDSDADGKGDVDWASVAENVDWIDLMAFDITGQFNLAGSLIANGETVSGSQTDYAYIENALKFYIDEQGVPARKIVLGSPAYACQMLVANEPNSANNYGFAGEMKYQGWQAAFDTHFDLFYSQNANWSQTDYIDAPNIDEEPSTDQVLRAFNLNSSSTGL
jgi:GH18 family chitinase